MPLVFLPSQSSRSLKMIITKLFPLKKKIATEVVRNFIMRGELVAESNYYDNWYTHTQLVNRLLPAELLKRLPVVFFLIHLDLISS